MARRVSWTETAYADLEGIVEFIERDSPTYAAGFEQRMERALLLGDYSKRTRRTYLCCMRHLVAYVMRPPDRLTLDDLHSYDLHLIEEHKLSRSWVNAMSVPSSSSTAGWCPVTGPSATCPVVVGSGA